MSEIPTTVEPAGAEDIDLRDSADGSPENGTPKDEGDISSPPAAPKKNPGTVFLEKLEAALKPIGIDRVLTYFALGQSMEDQDVDSIFEALDALGKVDRLAFIIETPGGDPDVAHLMSRALHAHVGHLDVFVLSRAASAGTLFSIGADTLWMGSSSRLGPIDPQVIVDRSLLVPSSREQEQPWTRGLTYFPAHAVRDFLELTGVIKGPDKRPRVDLDRLDKVMEFRLNPMLLGNYDRADKVSKIYAHQALTEHLLKNVKEPGAREAKASDIIHVLLDKYASHRAGILRDDARAIGIPVEDTPLDAWGILRELRVYYERALTAQKLSRIMETTTWASADKDLDFTECSSCTETVLLTRYCSNCGSQLYRTCVSCKAYLEDDAKFCGRCGVAQAALVVPASAPATSSS